MSKFEKTKQQILHKPTLNNIMPEDVKSFLEHYGFILKHVNGSHFIYCYQTQCRNIILNIPMHKPVKPTYIDQIRDAIIEIEGE